ncbi:hypothetical protein SAMN04488557_2170 [Hyphomicrobium facile]|uniref:Uncharacterized protein n=1 Tax=Hyphomicrobium facile TaxID=51670 RepID=A0A1I7NH24_9HYPH|nr:hypothetical protein SAMN04488557_2170 [Hyphomicrobium facile]
MTTIDTLMTVVYGLALWAIIITSIVKGFWTPSRLLRLVIGLAVIGATHRARIGDWEVWTGLAIVGFIIAEFWSRKPNKAQD